MDIKYKRDIDKSYMIMEAEDMDVGYEKYFLSSNDIGSLLSFYTVQKNGCMEFWYDISGGKSLKDYIAINGVSVEIISRILFYIKMCFEELGKYLISDKHILLNEDTIFIFHNNGSFKMMLTYYPSVNADAFAQLMGVFEFFMSVVKSEDERAQDLVYKLYEMCSDKVQIDDMIDLSNAMTPGADSLCAENLNVSDPDDLIGEFSLQSNEFCNEQNGAKNTVMATARKGDDAKFGMKEKFDAKEKLGSREIFVTKGKNARYEESDSKEKFGLKEESGASEKFGMKEKILEYIKDIIEKIKEAILKKKKELFPGKTKHVDFVFEPDVSLEEPTVLISDKTSQPEGRLMYEGEGGEDDYFLRYDRFTIGTNIKNNAVLHSKAVSRFHGVIERDEAGDYYIEDLNSTNGTFVNGTPLSYRGRQKLSRMDEIMFADVCYRIV